MSFYTPNTDEAIVVVYDLRDSVQWTTAGEARRAWGRERTAIHTIDNDHIAIEFKPGGALEVSA